MPTYGYQCTQCKHEFSVFQAMKDAALTQCPQCEGTIKRLLYPVGVIFKGSGWYVNDSRAPDKAADSQATGEKAPTEKSGETASTDTAATSAKTDKAASGPSTPAETKPAASGAEK